LLQRYAVVGTLAGGLLMNPAYAVSSPANGNLWDQFVDLFAKTLDYFYGITNNYGIAILIVTLIIRIIIFPFMIKQIKYSRVLQQLQPKMKEIREKYAGNQQKINEETMNLYKQYGANPLSGCLPILIQLPILWAFYRAIRIDQELMTHRLFGPIVLGQPDPTFMLPLAAALTTYLQQKVMMAGTGNEQQQKMLLIMMPAMIFIMSWKLPAALPLYWAFSNLFSVVQTFFVKKMPPVQGGAQS
jgi:YidC/Oxa1 family membrane protein insertase